MKSLFVGFLFLIFYAGYLLFTHLLFGENNLIELQGQLQKKENFVETETMDHKSTEYAYLTFMLENDRRLYILKVDINGIYQGFNVFGGVNKSLRDAGQISVWIKKSDYLKIRPKIYKIYTDGTAIFELKKKPGNNAVLYTVLACLTFLFAAIYYSSKRFCLIT
ncbi:MAG: hypothetical protein WC622_15200 [Pedobacter sp.]|jgi:hypothetical protein